MEWLGSEFERVEGIDDAGALVGPVPQEHENEELVEPDNARRRGRARSI